MRDLLDLLSDLWAFMKARQKYWLAPLIITLVLMGALLVFTSVGQPVRAWKADIRP